MPQHFWLNAFQALKVPSKWVSSVSDTALYNRMIDWNKPFPLSLHCYFHKYFDSGKKYDIIDLLCTAWSGASSAKPLFFIASIISLSAENSTVFFLLSIQWFFKFFMCSETEYQPFAEMHWKVTRHSDVSIDVGLLLLLLIQSSSQRFCLVWDTDSTLHLWKI